MILSTSRCPPWWESAGAATSKQGWLVTSAPSQPQRQMAPTHLELESAHTWWGREICSGVCFPVTFRCGEATRLLLKIKMKNDVLVALYILQKITIFNGRIYIIKNKIFWEISHAYNWDFFNREVMSIKYNWENMTYLIFFFWSQSEKMPLLASLYFNSEVLWSQDLSVGNFYMVSCASQSQNVRQMPSPSIWSFFISLITGNTVDMLLNKILNNIRWFN